MQVELCRHIKSNGIQCHAVALRDEHFCYFHKRLNEGHRLYRTTMAGKKRLMDRGFIIGLPPLEDRVSVQLALSEVINALACNFIDSKRANALFFGLKLAAANAKGLEAFPEPTAVVRDYFHAPDLLENVAVDIAPAGRTCEIEEPAPIDPIFADPDPIDSPAASVPAPEFTGKDAWKNDNSALELELEALIAAGPAAAIPLPEPPTADADADADADDQSNDEPQNQVLEQELEPLYAQALTAKAEAVPASFVPAEGLGSAGQYPGLTGQPFELPEPVLLQC